MLQKLKSAFREQIWNNEQVLKIRQRFSELDTQTQSYVIIGSFAGFVLVLLLSFFALWGRAIAQKSELAQMDETIRYVQSAAVRVEEYKEQAMNQAQDPLLEGFNAAAPLPQFLEQATSKSLIAKANVEIGEPRGPTAEIKLNRISLTQLTRMLFLIEHSGGGAKVERLNVDARDDTQGYLWATMLVRKSGG